MSRTHAFLTLATSLAGALAVGWPTLAAAAPLNPWGVHVGKGVLAVTPFVYVDSGPGVNPLVYGQYGVTESLEVLVGAGAVVVPGASFSSVELMPRYFFDDTTGVALHATWAPGEDQVKLAPEWHGFYQDGAVALTVNAGWGPSFGATGFSGGSLYAYIAPEWFFTEASSVFLEIDPAFDLTVDDDSFSLQVVPGISTAVAETHYFAVGVGIPVTGFNPADITVGAWYSIAFGGE